MPEAHPAAPVPPDGRWLLVRLLLLVLLILGATAGAVVYVVEQKKEIEAARLHAVATLKAQQINDWLQERMNDARLIQNSRYLAENFQRWRDHGDAAALANLRERLLDYLKQHQLSGILLLDESGKKVWHSGPAHGAFDANQRAAFLAAARQDRPSRLGPYLDASGQLHLDFFAPLRGKPGIGHVDEDKRPHPSVILHSDAGNYLPPALRAWPSPSASGEVLLLRREGDQVMYLNDTSHRHDLALRRLIPLQQRQLLAAQAITRPETMGALLQGVDYRGVRAIGVAQEIPDTDWIVLVKIDRSEFYAAARGYVVWLSLAGILAALIAAAGMFLFRQRRQLANAYQMQQAQTERLRALRLLAAIADSSNDAIFAKDLSGRYILFNRATGRILGKTDVEALGHDDAELLQPCNCESMHTNDQLVIAENRSITFEETLATPHGERIFQATKGPLRDDQGKVIGIFGISRDITERTLMEAALKERETSFRKLAEQIPAIIYRANLDELSQTIYISPRIQELGYTAEEWLAQPDIWVRNLHPDDRPPVLDGLKKFHAEGGPLSLEYRLQTRAGEWRHFQDEAEILRDEAGQPLYLQGLMLDITARREVDAQLAAARAQADMLADMLNRSAQPFGQGFADGRLGFHNQAFLDLVGYSEAEFSGLDWTRDLTPPEWLPIEQQRLEELQRGNKPVLYEKEYLRKDGSRVPIELLVHLIRDEAGQPRYYYAFITDISKRKQAEASLRQQAEELRQRNEELERFNRVSVNRELDMIQLKQRINALSLQLGLEPPFALRFLDAQDAPANPGEAA